jgi:hypothetical protein
MVDASPAINASLYDKLNFNFLRDTAPVGSVVRVPLILVVNPSVPTKTVAEFIAYAKANPGRISYGSAGIGSTLHVAGELFKMMTGVDLVHVPYRGGGPAIADLIAGHVQAVFIPAPAGIEYIRSGAIRALAVTAASRFEALPELPTVGEHVPGYEATTWYGVVVPRDTASVVIDNLNREINAGLADPKIKARISDMGGTGAPWLARRLRQTHHYGNREMGQGDPSGEHQVGLTPASPGRRFHNARYATLAARPTVKASGALTAGCNTPSVTAHRAKPRPVGIPTSSTGRAPRSIARPAHHRAFTAPSQRANLPRVRRHGLFVPAPLQ